MLLPLYYYFWNGDVAPDFDYTATIISQYANSPVIRALLADFDECVAQDANMDAFYNLIWNVDTAQGYGLDVWGRIVGVTRNLRISLGKYFGFQEASEADVTGFNQAPFYSGQPLTTSFTLSDSAFRRLIFAKALANITDGSITSINQLLLSLFPGRGDCFVTEGPPLPNMQMTYTFRFPLTPIEFAIVTTSGVLPKPVGVKATIIEV